MPRGGHRQGAGRPKGSTEPAITPEETCAALERLRGPGESWAGLARRLGLSRQALDNARKRGVTSRTVRAWEEAARSAQ